MTEEEFLAAHSDARHKEWERVKTAELAAKGLPRAKAVGIMDLRPVGPHIGICRVCNIETELSEPADAKQQIKDLVVNIMLDGAIQIEEAIDRSPEKVMEALDMAMMRIDFLRMKLYGLVLDKLGAPDCGDPNCPVHGSRRVPARDPNLN